MGLTIDEISIDITDNVMVHFGNVAASDYYLSIFSLSECEPGACSHMTETTNKWLDRARNVSGVAYSYGLVYMEWLKSYFDEIFHTYNLLITPAVPKTALGPFGGEKFPLLHLWSFLLPFNMSGHPSATIPLTRDQHGLPVAIQVASGYNQEKQILALANFCEQAPDAYALPYEEYP